MYRNYYIIMITQALSTKQLYPALSYTKDVFDHNNYGNENANYINSLFVANSKPFAISKKVPETKILKEMSVDPKPEQIAKPVVIKEQNFKVEKVEPIKVQNPFLFVTNGEDIQPQIHRNPDYYKYKINKYNLSDYAMMHQDHENGEDTALGKVIGSNAEEFMKLYEEDVKRRLDEVSLNNNTVKVGNKTFPALTEDELNKEMEEIKKESRVSTHDNRDTKVVINKSTIDEGIQDLNHLMHDMQNRKTPNEVVDPKDLYLYNLFLEKFDIKKMSKGVKYETAYKKLESALHQAHEDKLALNTKYKKGFKKPKVINNNKKKKLATAVPENSTINSGVSSQKSKSLLSQLDKFEKDELQKKQEEKEKEQKDKDEIRSMLSSMTHQIEMEDS